MIKLNHKNEEVKKLAFDIINTSRLCEMELFPMKEIKDGLVIKVSKDGYIVEYLLTTYKKTLRAVWQLDECPNPIFEV